MSATELLKKFDELEEAMKAYLDKVDPPLMLILYYVRREKEKIPFIHLRSS
jgi:hypothetical protein